PNPLIVLDSRGGLHEQRPAPAAVSGRLVLAPTWGRAIDHWLVAAAGPRRSQHQELPATDHHARHLPLLGQDGGSPAHLGRGTDPRRPAATPRKRQGAPPRFSRFSRHLCAPPFSPLSHSSHRFRPHFFGAVSLPRPPLHRFLPADRRGYPPRDALPP